MSTVAEIEAAILALPAAEIRRLTARLVEQDWHHWDEQFEQDVTAGRLDALGEEALADDAAGRTREV